MTRADADTVLDLVLEAATDLEIEATLGGGRSELTRFANNEITQNVSEDRRALSVRVVDGKRTSRVSGNDLSPEGIRRLIDRGARSVRLQPEIPGLPPLPGSQVYREVDAADRETAHLSPEARAHEVARAVARCQDAGLEAAGIYETGHGSIGEYGELAPFAMATSRGLRAYHVGTSATFRVSALDGTASGWAGRDSHRIADIDGAALADRAVQKAVASRNPVLWEPGAYTVVLEPDAVSDLLFELSYLAFGALAVQEGRSFMSGRIGDRVLGPNVTIRDDAFHPLLRGAPFDSEGMPTQRTTIIDQGVAVSPVYDRMTAAKEGRASTGHGLPCPNTFGPFARHLVLEGGEGTLETLISQVDRGLLVSRVWYTNAVDPVTATVTGMTRDGLFAIERGAVTHAVRNFRFNQSLVAMLNRVEARSAAVRAGGFVCPGLLVGGFEMSSVTEF